MVACNEAAQIFFPTDLDERKDHIFSFDVLCDPLGFVCRDAEVLNDIYLTPLILGAGRKELEFLTPLPLMD